MRQIVIIIPAFNEEKSVSGAVQGVLHRADEVVVINNASTDRTAELAAASGATVLWEPVPGYGAACLTGVCYAAQRYGPDDFIVFMDADCADDPDDLPALLRPLQEGTAKMVIGARVASRRQPGSLTPQQVFGNWLATRLIRLFFGVRYTDLGPFRALTLAALLELNMEDKDFGWTAEMQVKAARLHMPVTEVPVAYRRRVGVSKISGTVKGTLLAGHKILYVIFRYGFSGIFGGKKVRELYQKCY